MCLAIAFSCISSAHALSSLDASVYLAHPNTLDSLDRLLYGAAGPLVEDVEV